MFKIIRNKKKKTPSINHKKRFFSHPLHQWMSENKYIQAAMDDWYDQLPKKFQNYLHRVSPLILKCSRNMAFSAPNIDNPFIVLFPETVRLLSSTVYRGGLAVISHELAHLYLSHGSKKIHHIEAEVQADLLTCEMGHAFALSELIEDMPECEEKRIRLTYVTSYMAEHKIPPFDDLG
jgi:hypothetical protein